MPDSKERVEKLIAGHQVAEQAATQLRSTAEPAVAWRELLSALSACHQAGWWPGPRDLVAEARVMEVRRAWSRIQRRARELKLK